MAKKLQVAYWKSKNKVGKAPWAVDCRPSGKLQFFKTKAEAQSVIDSLNPVADNTWWTVDDLAGNPDAPKLYDNGEAIDFLSEQVDRNKPNRAEIAGKRLQFITAAVKTFCECQINGQRIGGLKVHSITGYQLQQHVVSQMSVGVSNKTLRDKWNVVVMLFAWANAGAGIIKSNPASEVQNLKKHGHKNKKRAGKMDRVQPDTISKIIAAMPNPQSNANHSLLDWGLMAEFAATTGLRQGEQRPLRWADLDLDEGFVSITHSMEDDFYDTANTKSGRLTGEYKTREVELSDPLIAKLKEWYIYCGRPSQDTLVWSSRSGHIVASSRFREKIREVCSRLEIELVHWHELRHFYAGDQLQRESVKEVSYLLGHSSTAVTERVYGHWVKDAAGRRRRRESANNSTLYSAGAS